MTTRTRWICVALALGGAVLLALAVQSGSWWSVSGQVEVRPMGSQWCMDGDCRAVDHTWLGGSELWERSGFATYVAALLSALILTILAGALAAGSTAKTAAGSALVAVLTAAVAGALFVALFPSAAGVSIGRGLFLHAGGVIVAGASAVVVLRAPLPVDKT